MYYNPDSTVLRGRPETWLCGGWNRWAHPRAVPPQRMQPVLPGGTGFLQATVQVEKARAHLAFDSRTGILLCIGISYMTSLLLTALLDTRQTMQQAPSQDKGSLQATVQACLHDSLCLTATWESSLCSAYDMAAADGHCFMHPGYGPHQTTQPVLSKDFGSLRAAMPRRLKTCGSFCGIIEDRYWEPDS